MKPSKRMGRIAAKRIALLDDLASIDEGELRAKPDADAWSVIEIIEHLVLAEEDIFGDFTMLAHREPARRTLGNWISFPLVMSAFRYRIPLRVPSRSMSPSGEFSFHELRLRWEANHALLTRFIENSDRVSLRQAVFRHPVTGPISVNQTMRMHELHLDRHIEQIKKTHSRSRDQH